MLIRDVGGGQPTHRPGGPVAKNRAVQPGARPRRCGLVHALTTHIRCSDLAHVPNSRAELVCREVPERRRYAWAGNLLHFRRLPMPFTDYERQLLRAVALE